MNELIKLININQEYKNEKILTNINLVFNALQNTVIYSDENQMNNCHLLLDIIAKVIAPQIGKVNHFNDKTSEFFIGYNIFDGIIEKDLIVLNILKALTTNHNIPQKEADELLKLLTIDSFVTKSAIDLSNEERQLLKAYLLLLIKPKVLILKSLSIPGTQFMQIAALQYIKNYLSQYKITLIIATNDKNTINYLCERGIDLSNNVIQSDVLFVKENQIINNAIDSKTKQYDYAENLLDSIYKLEEKRINKDENRANEKEFAAALLTKTLALNLNENEVTPTKALDVELENIIQEKRNLEKLDIQNNANIQTNITKTMKYMNNEEIDPNQLIEVYHQRRQLLDEIESASFTNLSISLQSKVYENYNRVNNIINKYDPTNKYDPYYVPSLDVDLEKERMDKPVNVAKSSITKMIFDENLDIDQLNVDDDEVVFNKTKEVSFTSTDYKEVKTKAFNTNDLTKKISSASDIEYMPHENKKKFWNFKKKPVNESESLRYVNPKSDNLTNEFLLKSKKQAPVAPVRTEKFEPTQKLLDIEPTDFSKETTIMKNEDKKPFDKKKEIIEIKIKKRSKLNPLEELYYEALEEKENMFKNK